MRYMYNKLFTKILDSSIWLEPMGTRIVWLTFIAAMDEDGFVSFASPANVARRANVELADAEAAIKALESPDSNSSDPDHEGRRVERVPGGWMVLNAPKYRELVTRTVAKEKTRLRVARHRAESGNAGVTVCNADVTPSNARVTPSEAETRSETQKMGASPPSPRSRREEKQIETYPPEARVALFYLNEKTGRSFRETAANLSFISSRLRESGVSIEGVRKMIDRQCALWLKTPQAEYLRPETLFNATKFDGYYAAKDLPINENSSPSNPNLDRNKGTLNAGTAHLYRNVGKVGGVQS